MLKGIVRFYNNTKGFGFISPDDKSEDVFVQSTGLVDRVRENDKVSYEIQNESKVLNAVKVTLIK